MRDLKLILKEKNKEKKNETIVLQTLNEEKKNPSEDFGNEENEGQQESGESMGKPLN